MAHLTIRLLGALQVTLDGAPLTDFESDKERALLAYLAEESGQPHTREKLAGLEASILKVTGERERRLQALGESLAAEPAALRAAVRDNPEISQIFVMDKDGKLIGRLTRADGRRGQHRVREQLTLVQPARDALAVLAAARCQRPLEVRSCVRAPVRLGVAEYQQFAWHGVPRRCLAMLAR